MHHPLLFTDCNCQHTHTPPITVFRQHLPTHTHHPLQFTDSTCQHPRTAHYSLQTAPANTHAPPTTVYRQHLPTPTHHPLQFTDSTCQHTHYPLQFTDSTCQHSCTTHYSLQTAPANTHALPTTVYRQHLPTPTTVYRQHLPAPMHHSLQFTDRSVIASFSFVAGKMVHRDRC